MYYDKIFELKELKFEQTDKDTLFCYGCVEFEEEETVLCVEVHLDENNNILIEEWAEDDVINVTDILTNEQFLHIGNLVKIELDKR